MESLKELELLPNQVKALRLEDKVGDQKLYEDMKKVFEHATNTYEDASEIVTKSTTETSKEGYKALSEINKKFLK